MSVSLRRRHLFVIALLSALVGIWFLVHLRSSRPQPGPSPDAAPAAQRPPVWYVELIETNRDTFPDRLFLEAEGSSLRPFRFEDGAVVVAEGVQAAIAGGTHEQEFQLFLDRSGLDPATQGRVFLVHEIRYAGVGREAGVADYDVFSEFPARVALPAFDVSSGTLTLTLDEAISHALGVRLFPGRELVLREASNGVLALAIAGETIELPLRHTHRLAQESATLVVTQELFAPIPKGPVSQGAFQPVTERYGSIEFSTELQITSQAVTEVRAE